MISNGARRVLIPAIAGVLTAALMVLSGCPAQRALGAPAADPLISTLVEAGVKPVSEEYARGWCAGWREAVDGVWNNRNHYRRMVKYPVESREDSYKRIYAEWPPKAPAGYVSTNVEAIDRMLHLEMAGIDLYVVLPDLPPGIMIYGAGGGAQQFTCP